MDFSAGEFVNHGHNGLGKVVYADGALVRVYFKGAAIKGANPTSQFPQGTQHLVKVASVPDAELDNLPPFKDGAFVQPKTSLDFTLMLRRFELHFPGGLDDPGFKAKEKDYKWSAHRRYKALFEPRARGWIASGNNEAIATALDQVYGDAKLKSGPDTRLNFMYQNIDEPAFFDALRSGGTATTDFAGAACDFIDAPGPATFDAYANALRALPRRKSGAQQDGWTVASWLPFIADPSRNVVIKPTLFKEFASALCYALPYDSDLNWRTYLKCVDFSLHLGDQLRDSVVNLGRRPLDLMDVQSFMWVVGRYSGQDSAGAK